MHNTNHKNGDKLNASEWNNLANDVNLFSSANNKEYDPENHSGLGRKTLQLKNGSNILTQDDFDLEDTIYIITYDFDLNGNTINLPTGSILDFNGGSLYNGTLTGSKVKLDIKELLGKVNISNLNIINANTLKECDFIDSNSYSGSEENITLGTGDGKTTRKLYKVTPGQKVYIGSLISDRSIGVYTYDSDLKTRGVIGYATSINTPITIPNDVYYIFIAVYNHGQNIDDFKIYLSCFENSLDISDRSIYTLTNTNNIKTIPLLGTTSIWITPSTGKITYPTISGTYSYIISKDQFRGYTHIRIAANKNRRTYWAALKSYPDGEYLDCCEDIPKPNAISAGAVMDYPIPSNCEYIYTNGFYTYDGENNDYSPFYIQVYSLKSGSIGDVQSKMSNNAPIVSNVVNQKIAMNVCHWNLGHFSMGDGVQTAITDEDYEEKRARFSAIITDRSCDYFFNEYNDVFAKLSTGDVSFRSLCDSYDYHECPHRNGIWNAAYMVTPHVSIDHREFNCYKGKVREQNNSLLVNDTYYTIYKFMVCGTYIYLVHVHYPLSGSTGADHHEDGYNEMINTVSGLVNVVIFGDLNTTDVSVFTSKGYSVANDNTPTHGDMILDWVLYKGSITISNFRVIQATELSDHNPVKFTIQFDSPFAQRVSGQTLLWTNENNRKPIWFSGSDDQWITADGEQMNIKRVGTSAQRPTPLYSPFIYFDTSINPPRPVFWIGNYWVDAMGTPMYFETVGTLNAQSNTFGTFAVVIDTDTYLSSWSGWTHLQNNTVYMRGWNIQGNPFQSGDRVRLVLSNITSDTEFMICYKDNNDNVSSWIVDANMYQKVHNLLDYVFTIPEGDNLDKLRIVVKSDSGYPDCTITLQKQ